MQNPKVTVIGEALIDLVPGEAPLAYRATPGGSPYNVAIGLARLGQDTTLMARLADNAFGHILRDRAVAEGIDLDAAPSNGSGHAGGLFISRRVPYVPLWLVSAAVRRTARSPRSSGSAPPWRRTRPSGSPASRPTRTTSLC